MWSTKLEVWQALIEARPQAKKWMSTPIQHYDMLLDLFGKDRATGEGAETAKEKRRQWENLSGNNMETICGIDQMMSQNEVTLESFDDLDGVDMMFPEAPSETPSVAPCQSATSSKGKKRKTVLVDESNEIQVIKGALDNVAEAIREGNSMYHMYRLRVYNHGKIFTALEEMGVDEKIIDSAYEFLTDNPSKASKLFGYPVAMRLEALERMMHGPNNP